LTELDEQVARIQKGDSLEIATALNCVEDERPKSSARKRELLGALARVTREGSFVVGVTGPPGAGKSTLCNALVRRWLARGCGVGVIAVDPSSQRSGGALLGDRERMKFAPHERAFIRSLAARDQLGGLAPAARAAVGVMRAAFDWTLVETVGVGQSELDVERVADVVVLVLQPGAGDTLQFMKAGILEIPDVIAVHKWDLGALAEQTYTDLQQTLSRLPGDRRPQLVGVSSQTGQGVTELAESVEERLLALCDSGELAHRRLDVHCRWALELLEKRYGEYGVERLGGVSAVRDESRRLVESAGCLTGLDLFDHFATRLGLDPPVW